MTVRFQADADLNAEIIAGVLRREPNIDFQTADAASLRRIPDPEVLALAAQEDRILVTHDRRTMPRHFAEFILHHISCEGDEAQFHSDPDFHSNVVGGIG